MSPDDPNPVFHILKEGVVHWLNGTEYSPDMSIFPIKLRDIISQSLREQKAIGWDQALRGYLSRKWRILASDSVFDNVPIQESKGKYNIRNILKAMYELTRKLWLQRCKKLHEADGDAVLAVSAEEQAELRALYEHPELVPAGDRHYCNGPLENILCRSPSVRRRWMRHMRMARMRYIQDGKRQTKMTSFFQPHRQN
jgi:hypothetical protein